MAVDAQFLQRLEAIQPYWHVPLVDLPPLRSPWTPGHTFLHPGQHCATGSAVLGALFVLR